MKCLVLIFISVTSTICSCAGQDLDSFRWKNRLVLLFSDRMDAPLMQQQYNLLTQQAAEVTDRDLKIFRLSPNGGFSPDGAALDPAFCAKQYQQWKVSKEGFSLLLIGKDGGAKMRQSEVVDPKVIFDLIDSMPMRRYEMRQKE